MGSWGAVTIFCGPVTACNHLGVTGVRAQNPIDKLNTQLKTRHNHWNHLFTHTPHPGLEGEDLPILPLTLVRGDVQVFGSSGYAVGRWVKIRINEPNPGAISVTTYWLYVVFVVTKVVTAVFATLLHATNEDKARRNEWEVLTN